MSFLHRYRNICVINTFKVIETHIREDKVDVGNVKMAKTTNAEHIIGSVLKLR